MDGNKCLSLSTNESIQGKEFTSVDSPFLDVTETADFLGVAKSTIDKWSSSGLLENCKCLLGRRVAFLRECLRDYRDQGKLDTTKKSNKKPRPSRTEVRKSLLKYINKLLRDPDFRSLYRERVSTEQLVTMLPVTRPTLYEWSSRGLMDGCKTKVGRQLSFLLECVLRLVAHDGLDTRSKPSFDEYDPDLPHEIEYVG
jgi:predicted DNA-binding transcriptional regulator AlpA